MFFCRISHSKITSRWLYARIFRATAVSEILPIKQGLKPYNKFLLQKSQRYSNKTRIETKSYKVSKVSEILPIKQGLKLRMICSLKSGGSQRYFQ